MERFVVLLVEDNPSDVEMARAQLAASGLVDCEVEVAGSLEAAVGRLARGGVDAVLLDLQLPDATGLAGLERLRGRFPGVPVVVLTVTEGEAAGLAAVRAGAHDYLAKSRVRGEELVRAVRHAAERSRLERAAREQHERYRELFESSLGYICLHDLEGRLLSVNPAAASALGTEPAALVGRSLAEVLHHSVRHTFGGYLARIVAQGFDVGLMTVQTPVGVRAWEYRNVLKRPDDGDAYVVAFATDVTDRIRRERMLREESMRDAVTGSRNERWLAMRAADPALGPQWGCVVVDLARSGSPRSGSGPGGNDVLVRMTRFLERYTRIGDAVVRVGGEQFVILLDKADERDVGAVVRRLRGAASASPATFAMGFATRVGREPLEATMARATSAAVTVSAERPKPVERRQAQPA